MITLPNDAVGTVRAADPRTDLFERAPIPRAVLSMCMPTVLSSLVSVLYNLADTFYVGQLNEPIQNAAVTLAAPVLLAFYAFTNLFGVGSSSMMSRALGAKDYKTIRRSSAFGFYMAFICGSLYSLLVFIFQTPLLRLLGAGDDNISVTYDYMFWTVCLGAVPSILNIVFSYLVRSQGLAMHAGIGTMSGCVLNIIIDPFFIMPWGLDMGAAGAGLATFIANCIACLYFVILIFVKRKSCYVSLAPHDFRPTKEIVCGVFKVGIPAAVQNLLNVTGMTVLNNCAAAYGSMAVAAMGVANKTTSVPMQIAFGISHGLQPLVGYNYASGNRKRMKKAILFALGMAVGLLTTTAILYTIFAPNIIALFMKNPEIVKMGAALQRGLCLAQPFMCVDFLCVGVFQACGMGHWSLLFAFLRKIVLEIPAIIILNRLFPMYGLAYAQPCAEFILCIVAVCFLVSIFRQGDRMTSKEEASLT